MLSTFGSAFSEALYPQSCKGPGVSFPFPQHTRTESLPARALPLDPSFVLKLAHADPQDTNTTPGHPKLWPVFLARPSSVDRSSSQGILVFRHARNSWWESKVPHRISRHRSPCHGFCHAPPPVVGWRRLDCGVDEQQLQWAYKESRMLSPRRFGERPSRIIPSLVQSSPEQNSHHASAPDHPSRRLPRGCHGRPCR